MMQTSSHAEPLVTLVRGAREPGGRDLFSCSRREWNLLLDLGRAFGWQARGTTYTSAGAGLAATSSVRHGYKPGESCDPKTIDADDAVAWATALERAKGYPELVQVISTRGRAEHLASQEHGAPFVAVLDEFIEYAYGGAFAFALDVIADQT